MNKHKVHFSSGKDDWETPKDLFEQINAKYGPFELDVCASHGTAKCDLYMTKEGYFEKSWGWISTADGLSGEWEGKTCWMNPPYSEIKTWLKKAYEESQKGARVVCLIPARTDTKAWHNYVMKAKEVNLVEGRVKFVGGKASAPFPSAIVVFEKHKQKVPKFKAWRKNG